MAYAGTRQECDQIASVIAQSFPLLVLQVDEDVDVLGAFYIYVISADYQKPDLTKLLPMGWIQTAWRSPDQRAEICLIEKEQ